MDCEWTAVGKARGNLKSEGAYLKCLIISFLPNNKIIILCTFGYDQEATSIHYGHPFRSLWYLCRAGS